MWRKLVLSTSKELGYHWKRKMKNFHDYAKILTVRISSSNSQFSSQIMFVSSVVSSLSYYYNFFTMKFFDWTMEQVNFCRNFSSIIVLWCGCTPVIQELGCSTVWGWLDRLGDSYIRYFGTPASRENLILNYGRFWCLDYI